MKIKNTGKVAEKIDPKEIAKALGAEIAGEFKTTSGFFGALQSYQKYKMLRKRKNNLKQFFKNIVNFILGKIKC